jgi:hypothetical protein
MRKTIAIVIMLTLAVGYAGPGMILDKNHKLDYRWLPDYHLEDLVLLRNSVFARYGYIFKSAVLREHFSSFGWYKPDKNFSFSMLSPLDQSNVNAILAEEAKKTAALKESFTGTWSGVTRYFLTVKEKERIPAGTEAEIKNFWKKNVAPFVLPDVRVPVLLSAACSDEKEAAFINGRVRKCGEQFTYWEASYDKNGALRRLRRFVCEEGYPTVSSDTFDLDDGGKVVMVRGGVRGTTVNYEYYYQYCLGRVAWIEVTLIDGSAGGRNKTERFFY